LKPINHPAKSIQSTLKHITQRLVHQAAEDQTHFFPQEENPSSFSYQKTGNTLSLIIETSKTFLLEVTLKTPPFHILTVASFVTGIMKFLNWTSLQREKKDKTFKTLRRHMILQHMSFQKRRHLSVPPKENYTGGKRTKTYFRFSQKRQTIYFGYHLPCTDCRKPTSFITSHQQLCNEHFRALQNKPIDPNPNGFFSSFNDHKHFSPNRHTRTRISRRLGITYRKLVLPNTRRYSPKQKTSEKYAVYATDIRPIRVDKKLSTKQTRRLQRFKRRHDFTDMTDTPSDPNSSKKYWLHPYHHANFVWLGKSDGTVHKKKVPDSTKYDLFAQVLLPHTYVPILTRSQYFCNECNFDYRNARDLKVHIRSQHKPEKEKDLRPNLQCPHCSKTKNRIRKIKTPEGMQAHLKAVHPELYPAPPYVSPIRKCPVCNHCFCNNESLQQHLGHKHSQ